MRFPKGLTQTQMLSFLFLTGLNIDPTDDSWEGWTFIVDRIAAKEDNDSYA